VTVRSSKYTPAQAQTASAPTSAAFSIPAPRDESGAASVPGFAGWPSGGGATKVPRQTSAPSTQTVRAPQPSRVGPQGLPSPAHPSVVLVVEDVAVVLVVRPGGAVLVVVAGFPAQKTWPFSSSKAVSAREARSACCGPARHCGHPAPRRVPARSYARRHECSQPSSSKEVLFTPAFAVSTWQRAMQTTILARLRATAFSHLSADASGTARQ